ncbi:hypothetical protein K450DRAFT_281007 [Umbelopsis ramanniana AG]|uniref:Methyltransferase-domain-containing protein n=1 Tax=Umbelopsis ramanniana AG TaxID=1314678 RepID=A0AAD5E816_UMBRA|nr:uncharacterized protein K450DRAFT_281007 [Umbelopsis ramanniana AG]KAI8579148.1 hypothetical protein K450DRAFT_281007 [Umbelopsis ramanniana AG]
MVKSITATICKNTLPPRYYSAIPGKDFNEDYYKHFYSQLNYNQMLYRIVLQRSTQKVLRWAQWSRVDLCLVNEMGLPSCQNISANIQVQLSCKLLTRRNDSFVEDARYQVDTQPLQDDEWGYDGQRLANTIGFDQSNRGGLQFRIRPSANDKLDPRSHNVYLYIFQSHAERDSLTASKVLPLVIGPLVINDHKDHSGFDPFSVPSMWSDVVSKNLAAQPAAAITSVNEGFWDQKQETNRSYRAYPFRCGQDERYILLEENWRSGMPGKIWDGALVITDIFAKRLAKDPSFLDNVHIMDLSAGLGCFGVAISFIYQILRRHNSVSRHGTPPSVTLTDLQEALPLIRRNYQLNMPPAKTLDQNNQQQQSLQAVSHPFVSITPLRWGMQCDSQKVTAWKPIDYIIASDVLYDPSKTSALLQTLIHLSSPGVTTVYLVYKKRALKREEEEAFFMGCRQYFDLSVMPEYPNETGLCRDESSVDGSTWLGCDIENTSTPHSIQATQFGVVVYLMKRR